MNLAGADLLLGVEVGERVFDLTLLSPCYAPDTGLLLPCSASSKFDKDREKSEAISGFRAHVIGRKQENALLNGK